MSDHDDYRTFTIPDDEDPENYTTYERRAEVLQRIEDPGHPGMVNGAKLARRYGVTRQSIYKDFDVPADYVADTVGTRR